MRKLSESEYMLCGMQADIFELSVGKVEYSSAMFIRRYMNSQIVKELDEERYLYISFDYVDVLDEIDNEFGKTAYGKEKYPELVMHWLGYIYRYMCIAYGISSKQVYKLFPTNKIIKSYNGFHSMNPEVAAIKLMERFGYDIDISPEKKYFYEAPTMDEDEKKLAEKRTKQGLAILKRLLTEQN